MVNRLRGETRELHTRLEANPLHRAIADGSVTRESYLLLLERMYGIHAAFEEAAGTRPEWAALRLDFDVRRKLPLLNCDFAALGAKAGKDRLPEPDLGLDSAGFAFVLGYFYVLEGSTLGGQILRRMVGRHLGLAEGFATRYFSSYGEKVGERWGECQHLLNQVGVHTEEAGELVAGARDAFVQIEAWLHEGWRGGVNEIPRTVKL